MKFIRDLMSRKPKEVAEKAAPRAENIAPFEDVIKSGEEVAKAVEATPEPASAMPRSAKLEVRDIAPEVNPALEESNEILEKLTSRLSEEAEAAPAGGVNIWDIEDENDTVEAAAPVAAAPSPRRRRNATRVLGFDAGNTDVVSMFDEAPVVKGAERTKFPVGWILVEDGPGRGECFTLEAGMSQIGRGEDQAIQLDFGDNSISRTNHAAIVYDTDTHTFSLGHGGKKNIVRLNGEPVISNEAIKAGDKIKIGETTLHFVPLCSEDFNWAEDGTADDDEENDNVAIA